MKVVLNGLYGLRGISILIVLLSHIKSRSISNLIILPVFDLFFDGNFGVHVFFVLSGFLITYLSMNEVQSNGFMSIKSFYLKRIFRILPPFLLLLFFYAVLQFFCVIHLSFYSWLSSLFFLKWFFGGDWISGHFWSLGIEENFYLIWPFLFKFNNRKTLIFILFTIVVCSCVYRVLGYYDFLGSGNFSSSFFILYHIDSLAIGCLGAIFLENYKKLTQRHKLDKYFLLWVLLMSLFSSSLLVDVNYQFKLHLGFLLIPLGVGNSSGIIVSICILLVLLTLVTTNSLIINYFFNNKLLVFLGKLSYSIYLCQQIFFAPEITPFDTFPINLLLILIISCGSYYLVSRPFLKYRLKFLS